MCRNHVYTCSAKICCQKSNQMQRFFELKQFHCEYLQSLWREPIKYLTKQVLLKDNILVAHHHTDGINTPHTRGSFSGQALTKKNSAILDGAQSTTKWINVYVVPAILLHVGNKMIITGLHCKLTILFGNRSVTNALVHAPLDEAQTAYKEPTSTWLGATWLSAVNYNVELSYYTRYTMKQCQHSVCHLWDCVDPW